MNKDKLLISACLTGKNCKYNGGNNQIERLQELVEKYELIPVCPEQLGGLSTPRNPSEIKEGRVVNTVGTDVTDAFSTGAKVTLKIALDNNCSLCLLKERSPSCGANFIYSGDFSGTVIKGSGITAKLLREKGFKIFTEEEIDKLLDCRR